MTIAVETYLVVALAFAVFAAVTALGSSLVLGVGFERLRAGFEVVKSQTGFFADSIHRLDKRTDSLEKQGTYFFESITKLEQAQKDIPACVIETDVPDHIHASGQTDEERPALGILMGGSIGEIRFH